MARERRGAAIAASPLPSAGQGVEEAARRHTNSWVMNEADGSTQRRWTICQPACMPHIGAKTYAEAHVGSQRCSCVTRNVPAAVHRCHIAASSMGAAFLKRSATASTILVDGAGLARTCLWRALQERVARIEQKWHAVLGQKGTYRQAINADAKPKVQNRRRERAGFDDPGSVEHASCGDDLCARVHRRARAR